MHASRNLACHIRHETCDNQLQNYFCSHKFFIRMELPVFMNDLHVHEEYAAKNPDVFCLGTIIVWDFYVPLGPIPCSQLLNWRKQTIEFGETHKAECAEIFEHRLSTMFEILKETKLFGNVKLHKAAKYFRQHLPELLVDYKHRMLPFDLEVLMLDSEEKQADALMIQFIRYAYIGFYVIKFLEQKEFNGFHVQTSTNPLLKPSSLDYSNALIGKPARGDLRMVFKCDKCFRTDKKLLNCGSCRLTRYCSRECQKSHWKEHKVFCEKSKQNIVSLK